MKKRNKLFLSVFVVAAMFVFVAPEASAGEQTIEGDIYTIKIVTGGGKATITITPKKVGNVEHYCNPEFPWKLQIKGPEGVTTDQTKYEAPFKTASGGVHTPSHTKEFGKKKVVYVVKYKVPAGKKVEAKLTFSVCDPTACHRKTQKIFFE